MCSLKDTFKVFFYQTTVKLNLIDGVRRDDVEHQSAVYASKFTKFLTQLTCELPIYEYA